MTNEEVLRKMRKERLLLDTIRERQWRCVGHLLREDSGLERHVIVTELDGKSAKGRPRMKMFDWMKRRLNVRREEDMMDVARDR